VAPPVLGLVQHAADKSLLLVTWRRAVHFAMSLLILPGPLLLSPSGPPLLLRAALGEQARRLRALCGRGRSAMEDRGGVPLTLHTADGAVLSAMLLQPAPVGPGGGGAPQPRRVVLRLNGNSEAWEMADRDAVQGYLDQGYTVRQRQRCPRGRRRLRARAPASAGSAPLFGSSAVRGQTRGRRRWGARVRAL
jgi:hypothetical protein